MRLKERWVRRLRRRGVRRGGRDGGGFGEAKLVGRWERKEGRRVERIGGEIEATIFEVVWIFVLEMWYLGTRIRGTGITPVCALSTKFFDLAGALPDSPFGLFDAEIWQTVFRP